METKHTPGPWEANKARTVIHIAADGHYVCGINLRINIPEKEMREKFTIEQEANAKLIAAAPALLAALRGLLKDAPSTETLDAVNAEYTFRKVTLTVTDVDIRAAHSALLSAE